MQQSFGSRLCRAIDICWRETNSSPPDNPRSISLASRERSRADRINSEDREQRERYSATP
jgi:hypothetical protein